MKPTKLSFEKSMGRAKAEPGLPVVHDALDSAATRLWPAQRIDIGIACDGANLSMPALYNSFNLSSSEFVAYPSDSSRPRDTTGYARQCWNRRRRRALRYRYRARASRSGCARSGKTGLAAG
jgi:hypothetical protein